MMSAEVRPPSPPAGEGTRNDHAGINTGILGNPEGVAATIPGHIAEVNP